MNITEIYTNLCSRDQRNPLYADLWPIDLYAPEEVPTPRKDCYCDNCFYGRDTLALEIIRLRAELTLKD